MATTIQAWKSAEADVNQMKAEAIEATQDAIDSIIELLPPETAHDARSFRAKLISARQDFEALAQAERGS
jgi:hypothetical protein